MDKVGRIAFIVGGVVSLLAGFMTGSWIFPALTVMGLLVGILNVGAGEVKDFLLAAIGLVIISAMGAGQITALPVIGATLGRIYLALLTFVAPAAIIVAMKALYGVAKD